MRPSRALATSLSAPAEQRRWRYQVLPTLRGTVLDVGAGSGICGAALDPRAHWLALEPSPGRRLAAAVRARSRSRLLSATAEQIPLEDGSVDAVICSTVLCSVTDPPRALTEILRVLRHHGRLVFFEHVASAPGTAAHRAQRLVRPLTRLLGHGCDPCRDTAATIYRAGFSAVELETLRTGGPLGGLAPVIRGQAVR
ncbi:class I SAM-dependent methyltransferase [Actinomyces lilanjuaniae]|uniref:Class I SAM-dependent methyltransferase n=1 Tax=Actinomyces lilanjuaniae TaxID=2321394 RepID=A0ABM6Z2D4_9ACTO|nr:class I SAM-dependent methyltransferase [Actinomyces lilanjuaniae]AYD89141.1 class I SAM-dependent methyltransferase [Actinomyces lilanjuaniae]